MTLGVYILAAVFLLGLGGAAVLSVYLFFASRETRMYGVVGILMLILAVTSIVY